MAHFATKEFENFGKKIDQKATLSTGKSDREVDNFFEDEEEGEVWIKEKALDQALANLPQLLTEIRAVPYFEDGKAKGLRLFAIKSGSIFERIGWKNGDIIKEIDDAPLKDFTPVIKIFDTLKRNESVSILIERNREKVYRTYILD